MSRIKISFCNFQHAFTNPLSSSIYLLSSIHHHLTSSLLLSSIMIFIYYTTANSNQDKKNFKKLFQTRPKDGSGGSLTGRQTNKRKNIRFCNSSV
ncbi:hypothetical protein DERP_013066 [Dermatophagoides pteronyssinus]|uniref:Uncharacterized protein n=1 Tax=Dermatophagoides pteronyssinus TaxID=6956 RepID=A0ABQ8JPV4_DERPT|nr:hypothetical protein DERP_013066 [Dermatophagoides pteronyssinus]